MRETLRLLRTPLLLVLLCLALGRLVSAGYGRGLDSALLSSLAMQKGEAPEFLVTLALAPTRLGNGEVRWLVMLAVAALLFWMGSRRGALAMIIAPVLASSAASFLKLQFARARPDLFPQLDPIHSFAYPSGHATHAVALYLLAGWFLSQQSGHRFWLWLCGALALLISLSRPMLAVHWPSDIVGGWLLGGAFALAAARLAGSGKPAG